MYNDYTSLLRLEKIFLNPISDMTYGWNGFMDGFAVYYMVAKYLIKS